MKIRVSILIAIVAILVTLVPADSSANEWLFNLLGVPNSPIPGTYDVGYTLVGALPAGAVGPYAPGGPAITPWLWFPYGVFAVPCWYWFVDGWIFAAIVEVYHDPTIPAVYFVDAAGRIFEYVLPAPVVNWGWSCAGGAFPVYPGPFALQPCWYFPFGWDELIIHDAADNIISISPMFARRIPQNMRVFPIAPNYGPIVGIPNIGSPFVTYNGNLSGFWFKGLRFIADFGPMGISCSRQVAWPPAAGVGVPMTPFPGAPIGAKPKDGPLPSEAIANGFTPVPGIEPQVHAANISQGIPGPRMAFMDYDLMIEDAANPPAGTVYLGGTHYDAADSRWEADLGGTWTFETGIGSHFDQSDPGVNPEVNQNKDPSLHARMEGWHGADFSGSGDCSRLEDVTLLPPPSVPYVCDFGDSVLLLSDPIGVSHDLYKHNVVFSPWIDLAEHGLVGYSNHFVEFQGYFDMPLQNRLGLVVMAAWKSPSSGDLFDYDMRPVSAAPLGYFGTSPKCISGDKVVRVDLSGLIPPDATEVGIGLGVWNQSRFYEDETGVTNASPFFDNVRFGVHGSITEPPLAANPMQLPQDAFPENGTVRPDATARLDAGGLIYHAPMYYTGGDTIVVASPGQEPAGCGTEVRVQFAVTPGPGIDMAALTAWLTSHQLEGNADGQTWYSARLDTAEVNGTKVPGMWMTTYHEDDPNFTGSDTDTDPADIDPNGKQNRLLNDIFPDNLFTPGTRVNMFFQARYIDGSGNPKYGTWTNLPMGPATGDYHEYEVLPSSMEPDTTWNCVLYVNSSDEPDDAQIIESGLSGFLPGSSSNYEQTKWDRYDVRAASSGTISLGRSLFGEGGATPVQLSAYETIIFDTGSRSGNTTTAQDIAALEGRIALTENTGIDFGLMMAGDNIANDLATDIDPAKAAFLDSHLGTTWLCNDAGISGCGVGSDDTTPCVTLAATLDPHVLGNTGGAKANTDTTTRNFDLLEPSGSALGTANVNEEYTTTASGTFSPGGASISHHVTGGTYEYRTMLDGVSLTARRDSLNCIGTFAVEDRLTQVLGWMGVDNADPPCGFQLAAIDVAHDPDAPPPVSTLRGVAPQPMRAGSPAEITFSLKERAKVLLEVYDVQGRQVVTLVDQVVEKGVHGIHWAGRNQRGQVVPQGVYFYRFKTENVDVSKKVVIIE